MTTVLGLLQAALVLVVFWGPGTVVLRAAGLRGQVRTLAVAPAATIAVFFVGAWTAWLLHLRWNLAVALGFTAVAALLGHLWRGRAARGASREDPPGARARLRELARATRDGRVPAAVLATAVVVQLVPVWRPFLRRAQIPNLADNVFHLNALEYVRTEGVAAPTVLGALLDPTGATRFYPTGWHAVAGTIPVVLDNTSLMASASFVVIAVAWSFGLAALARAVAVRAPQQVMVLAGALSACGMSSPLERTMQLGTIPDGVGSALAPGIAAVVVELIDGRLSARRRYAYVVAVLLVGLGCCHPSALVGVVIILVPWLAWAGVGWWRAAARRPRLIAFGSLLLSGGAIALFVATDPLVARIRTLRGEATMRPADAVVGLLSGFTFDTVTFALVVPAFALLATIVRGRRREDPRPLASWLLVGTTYLLAATGAAWAMPVTGLFYGEGRRVAPFTAIWAIVLGAEGMAWASRWLVAQTELPDRLPQGTVVAVVSGFFVLLTPWQALTALPRSTAETYATTSAATVTVFDLVPYFSPAELAMVDRLPSELPAGSELLGSVRSGVSLVYGITGIHALPFARGIPDDLDRAALRLDAIEKDPSVCRVLRAHGVTHVYVDSHLWKIHGEPVQHDPFGELPPQDFRLVDQGGTAKVYAIVGCDR